MTAEKKNTSPTIQNRAARHNYAIQDNYECGIILTGTEVKSVRQGKLTLTEAYVIIRNDELFLVNAYIEEYTEGNRFNHKPTRERKLLAHRAEIKKMHAATQFKGYALIPLKAYFKGSVLKIDVGFGKGKDKQDKREDKSKQEAKRDIARALKAARF